MIASACKFFFKMVPLKLMQLAHKLSKFSAPNTVNPYKVVVMQFSA